MFHLSTRQLIFSLSMFISCPRSTNPLTCYYNFFACLSIFFYLFQCPRCVDAILFPRFSPTQNAFTWGGGREGGVEVLERSRG